MIEKFRNRVVPMVVSLLRIHPSAQRDAISAKRVQKLMEDFDLNAVGTLHAAHYHINGELAYWVIDGAHRLTAMRLLGFGEWEVDVMIHENCVTDAAASRLFRELNDRLLVNSWDKFRNDLQAGEPSAVDIVARAQKHGLTVGKWSNDHQLACVTALTSIWNIDEGQTLDRTLSISTSAWGYAQEAGEGKILEGLAKGIASGNGDINDTSLTRKLAKYPGGPMGLLAAAKGVRQYKSGSIPHHIQELVLDLNKKRTR